MSDDAEIVTATPMQIINIMSAYLEQSPIVPDAAKAQPGGMVNSGAIAGWARPRMDPDHVNLDLAPPGSLGHPRITIKNAKTW